MLKRSFLFGVFFLVAHVLVAQAPADYYRTAKGEKGRNLKTALFEIVSNHVERTYKQLWTDFEKTDRRADGKVWDMYSDKTNFTFGRDQAGNYTREGDVYNREHSFPKSWFSEQTPMYSDLFHLYPTDGWVNSLRGNHPFGETDRPTNTSHNGWSKLGPSSVAGYTGTVFEPNDEYKGDFARTYFYMATAYEDRFSTFHSPMLAGNAYPGYKDWAIKMLLRWAQEDPVSEKEIDRNNAVYEIQKNRNPYIDYPGLEQYVWGNKQSVAFDPDHYDAGGEVDPNPQPGDQEVALPVFSVAGGKVAAGTEVLISCSTPGAYIYYTVNGGETQVGFAPVKYRVEENVTIAAYAMVGESRSETVQVSYTVSNEPVQGSGVYTHITTTAELQLGYRYLMVCESEQRALAGIDKDVRGHEPVNIVSNSISTEVSAAGLPYALVLGGNAQGYTFYDAETHTYLGLTSNKNKLNSLESGNGPEALWTVSFTDGAAVITNVKYNERFIQFNEGSPRFATYTHTLSPIALYKESVVDAIEFPEMENGKVDVYNLSGRLIRAQVDQKNAVKGLPQGIYVVGGRKLLVK